MNLQEAKNKLAGDLFGMSMKDAHKQGICVDCKQDALANCYSDAGRREYQISGLCEKCFDRITG